jgi:hypothetical protein
VQLNGRRLALLGIEAAQVGEIHQFVGDVDVRGRSPGIGHLPAQKGFTLDPVVDHRVLGQGVD